MTNNIKQFPKKNRETLPAECQNTEAYPMMEIMIHDGATKTVTDFTNGEQRNRRWGMVVSFSIIPNYHENVPNQGPLLYPKLPSRLFLGDSLEEIKARINFEIDKAIKLAKLAVEDPEAFARETQAQMQRSLGDIDIETVPAAEETDMN